MPYISKIGYNCLIEILSTLEDYNGVQMHFVRIIFYFVIVLLFTNCQIIEFPEDVNKQPTEDSETVPAVNIPDKTEPVETTSDVSIDEINKPVRPADGFIQDASLALQRDLPFTNFDVRDLTNPFFVVVQFLDAVKNRDINTLQTTASPDLSYFRKIDLKDTSEFWSYMRGIIGLYRGITELSRDGNNLSFSLQPVSRTASTTVIVLEISDNTWLVSNVYYIVKTENLKTHDVNKHVKGTIIWKGSWDFDVVEKYDFEIKPTKTTMFELINTILTDAKDAYDMKASDYFLTSEIAEKSLPAIIRNSANEYDSKLNENVFLINFYKSYKMTNLLSVSQFPLSANIQLDTYAVFFDAKINPIVFVSWVVINGIPYIERIELPTGSYQQIYFDN